MLVTVTSSLISVLLPTVDEGVDIETDIGDFCWAVAVGYIAINNASKKIHFMMVSPLLGGIRTILF